MSKTIVYLSGPMTGREDYNYPAFHEAARKLRKQGFIVSNPAENLGGYQGLPKHTYMRRDLNHVMEADAVAVLEGWQESDGAVMEVVVANQLNKPIVRASAPDERIRVQSVDVTSTTVVEP